MKQFLLAALFLISSVAMPYSAFAAKTPDCEYCAYGCCVYGYNIGNGRANFVTECEVGDNEWIMYYDWDHPAGAC